MKKRRIKRVNPVAKDLRTSKYRIRIERDPKTYTRKNKFKKDLLKPKDE